MVLYKKGALKINNSHSSKKVIDYVRRAIKTLKKIVRIIWEAIVLPMIEKAYNLIDGLKVSREMKILIFVICLYYIANTVFMGNIFKNPINWLLLLECLNNNK